MKDRINKKWEKSFLIAANTRDIKKALRLLFKLTEIPISEKKMSGKKRWAPHKKWDGIVWLSESNAPNIVIGDPLYESLIKKIPPKKTMLFDNFVIEHVPSHHTGGNGVTMGNDGGIVPPYIRIIKPLILT